MVAHSDMTGLEIVGFETGLLRKAAALRAHEFGGTPEANLQYFTWKYVDNPYLEAPIVHFAVFGEEVIGMRGAMGTCWQAGDRRCVIPHGGDFLVHSQFRRRGVGRRVLAAGADEMRSRGFDYAITLSSGRLGAPALLASGWISVGNLDPRIYVSVPLRTRASRLGRRAGGRLGRLLKRPDLLPTASTPFAKLDRDGPETVVATGAAHAAHIAEIAGRTRTGARLCHVRDGVYLEWRLRKPFKTYRTLLAPDAYLILQWDGRSSHVNVVDWCAAVPEQLSELIRAAMRCLPELRVWVASLDGDVASVLGERHFRDHPGSGPMFALRGLRDDGDAPGIAGFDPCLLSTWRLQMLDSDTY